MTRKHFKAIAENSMNRDQKVILADALRVPFKQANRAFDFNRFLDACLGES